VQQVTIGKTKSITKVGVRIAVSLSYSEDTGGERVVTDAGKNRLIN
jgi:hypothetical protein